MTFPKHSFIPGFLFLSIVTILLCLPGSAIPQEHWLKNIPTDKIVHVTLFCILFLLWYWPAKRKNIQQAIPIVLICLLTYGIVMEVVQYYFIPNRSFEVADMMADAGGLLLGLIISRKAS